MPPPLNHLLTHNTAYMAESAYYELADSMPNSTEYAKISWKWPEFCLDMAHSTYYIMYQMHAITL